jgi:simple sugar transport system permease protein
MAFVVHKESVGIAHLFYNELQSLAIPLGGRVYLPLTVIVLLICYALAVFAAQWTPFGREVYAVGGDEGSASLMGVNIGRVKIGVYALGGLTAAIAGVIATTDMYSGNPKGFEGYELDAIAAVVIGGTLLTGGVGYIIGTLMGVLILGLIRMVIDNEGTLSTWWTNISAGLLLFLFILLQAGLVRTAKRRS